MLKRPLFFIASVLLLLTVSSSGCSYITGESPGYPPVDETLGQIARDVSVNEANTIIADYTGEGYFAIIDVRTAEEFAAGHISGAVNLDYNSSAFIKEIAALDRYGVYVIYCRSGARSAAAFKTMKDFGFMHIYNLTGGITAWEAAGLPLAG